MPTPGLVEPDYDSGCSASSEGAIRLGHFCLLKRIGSGDISNVYLCRRSGKGRLYAMKVIDRERLAMKKKLHRAEREREIMRTLHHPFLPTLYADFDVSRYSCLVMEFCPGGDLHAAMLRQPQRRFSVRSARFYAADTVVALEYLHRKGVVYRDLKPENVLVRNDGHIMLSDFDLCFRYDVVPRLRRSRTAVDREEIRTASFASPLHPVLSCFRKKKRCTTIRVRSEMADELPTDDRALSFVGTHEYVAPEVIIGTGHGAAVDWWALGVFLYELLHGTTPFKGDGNDKTLMNILKQPLEFPGVRLRSAGEAEEMRSARELIRKLLVKNPRERMGTTAGEAEIKAHAFFRGLNWALIGSATPPEVPVLPRAQTHRHLPYFDWF